jgi:hypothetical protein
MNPNATIATMRILWAALLSSVGLFAVIILILPPAQVSPDRAQFFIFIAVAAATAVSSFVLPAQAHAANVRRAALETHDVPDPEAPAGFGDVKRVQVFKDPARARGYALGSYQMYMILGCALSEAVAMFGLVLDRLGHPPQTTLPFVIAGLLLMAVRYPVEAKAIALFEGVAKARLR